MPKLKPNISDLSIAGLLDQKRNETLMEIIHQTSAQNSKQPVTKKPQPKSKQIKQSSWHTQI